MEPIRITATLDGPIALPSRQLAIDGLLAWAAAQREQLPPPSCAEDCTPLEIPITREPGGQFHLASFALYELERADHRWTNRRFPIEEAQMMGNSKLRRVLLSGGPTKSFRIPLETWWLTRDRIDWYAIGDPNEVEDLLGWVGYLGKRRAVGLGRVRAWSVEQCEPWGDGFPVVRDGKALRTLPLDWPGLVDPAEGLRCLSYPYWSHAAEVRCAVPG